MVYSEFVYSKFPIYLVCFTSKSHIIHSPMPAKIDKPFSFFLPYLPSLACLIHKAKMMTIPRNTSKGMYFTRGINNSINDSNKNKTKIIHRPIACLRWKLSYSLCPVLPNHQIMPMRRYITTALFFSTLLGR